MNKKIIKVTKIQPEKTLIISKITDEAIELMPFNTIYKEVKVLNPRTIPEECVKHLGAQWTHGATITIEFWNGVTKSFSNPNPKPLYRYEWQTYSLANPVPRALAEYTFLYKNKITTYIDALRTLTSNYIPPEMWKALDDYSKERIEKVKEYNLRNYEQTEQFYKALMKLGLTTKAFKAHSPNKKTYYEAVAELTFEKEKEEYLIQGEELTDEQVQYLRKYAPLYGIEIRPFRWRINTRKTDHGYTEEPEVVLHGMSHSDWNSVIYDFRNKDALLPGRIRQNLRIKEIENPKLLLEAYNNLIYIQKYLGDDGLMPSYHRCPKCNEIYHEQDGCPCGYCEPINTIPGNNLFYGIPASEDTEEPD